MMSVDPRQIPAIIATLEMIQCRRRRRLARAGCRVFPPIERKLTR